MKVKRKNKKESIKTNRKLLEISTTSMKINGKYKTINLKTKTIKTICIFILANSMIFGVRMMSGMLEIAETDANSKIFCHKMMSDMFKKSLMPLLIQ